MIRRFSRMKVAILGCGAMGTVLGAYMTKNGCDVEMIDSYQAHVDALNEKGAHIVG
ncbi:MAG: ketopantoate reductase family protein, partial [Flavonifractor plautii]